MEFNTDCRICLRKDELPYVLLWDKTITALFRKVGLKVAHGEYGLQHHDNHKVATFVRSPTTCRLCWVFDRCGVRRWVSRLAAGFCYHDEWHNAKVRARPPLPLAQPPVWRVIRDASAILHTLMSAVACLVVYYTGI